MDESKFDSNESKFDLNFGNFDMGEPMLGNLEGMIGLESDEIPVSSRTKEVREDKGRLKSSREQFCKCTEEGKKDHGAFSPKWIVAIQLMDLMNNHGGSLELYDAIFKWHVDNLEAKVAVSEELLHKRLMKRYNLNPTMAHEVSVYVPHAKETVPMPCHDIKAMTIDLLADTSLTDDDCLFF